MSVVGYADDPILLAPSRQAAQLMLQKWEQLCMENNIQFSPHTDPSYSKSKVIYVVGPRGGELPHPKPLQLCGQLLPWLKHLGLHPSPEQADASGLQGKVGTDDH